MNAASRYSMPSVIGFTIDAAVLGAFDLIELDGQDIRGARLENRKHKLADLLRKTNDGIAFNKHFDGDGAIIFRHACALGCEGIVSKRLGSAVSLRPREPLAQDQEPGGAGRETRGGGGVGMKWRSGLSGASLRGSSSA